jgi:hypothetical protein
VFLGSGPAPPGHPGMTTAAAESWAILSKRFTSPKARGPQAVHVVGEDDPGVDVERGAAADFPNRVAQRADPRHQQIRAPVEQPHREEECSAGTR